MKFTADNWQFGSLLYWLGIRIETYPGERAYQIAFYLDILVR